MVKKIAEKSAKKKTSQAQYKPWLLDILAMIHAYLLCAELFPLAASACGNSGRDWYALILLSLLLFIALVISYFLVRKIRIFALYLLTAALYLAIAGGTAYKVTEHMLLQTKLVFIAIVLVGGILIFSIRAEGRIALSKVQQDFHATHEGVENVLMDAWESANFLNCPRPIHWIWTSLVYIPAVLASYRQSYNLIFLMFFTDVVVVFLFMYLDSFYDYIRDHHRIANLPLNMMKRVHKSLTVIALALILAVSVPALALHREPMDGYRINIKLDLPADTFQTAPEDPAVGAQEDSFADMLGDEDVWVPPAWLVKLMNVIDMLLFAGAIFIVLRLIWNKLKEESRDFSVDDEDEVIFLDDVSDDIAESLYGQKKKKESFLSVNAQIRRKYRKAILKGTKGKPQKWATPEELERDAAWKQTNQERLLHELYEKARYSKDGCEREELQKL